MTRQPLPDAKNFKHHCYRMPLICGTEHHWHRTRRNTKNKFFSRDDRSARRRMLYGTTRVLVQVRALLTQAQMKPTAVEAMDSSNKREWTPDQYPRWGAKVDNTSPCLAEESELPCLVGVTETLGTWNTCCKPFETAQDLRQTRALRRKKWIWVCGWPPLWLSLCIAVKSITCGQSKTVFALHSLLLILTSIRSGVSCSVQMIHRWNDSTTFKFSGDQSTFHLDSECDAFQGQLRIEFIWEFNGIHLSSPNYNMTMKHCKTIWLPQKTISSDFAPRPCNVFWRELMYAIYGNIYHQYTPVMLAYISSTMDPMGMYT